MPANQLNIQSSIPNQNVSLGALTQQGGGLQGDAWVSPLHGEHYASTYSGNTFYASASGVTVPLTAQSFVSVFSLWNPYSSTANLELIMSEVGVVNATTVVNHVGLYGLVAASAQTLTTAGTAVNCKLGSGVTPQGKFYTAATHVGAAPSLLAMVATFGAVTTTNAAPILYDFKGRVIVTPGSIVSFAMSTATSTATGLSLGLSWKEWPI